MRKVIVLVGPKSCGKTTTFNLLKENVERDFEGKVVVELTLAGKLKSTVGSVFNLSHAQLNDPVLKEAYLEDPIYIEAAQVEALVEQFGHKADYNTHIRDHVGKVCNTPRELLQYVGTQVLRRLDDNIHINTLIKQINDDENRVYVVTDARFTNEFEFFEKAFGRNFVPLYIKNPNAEVIADQATHESETQYRQFRNRCALVDNNSTIPHLLNNVKYAVYGKINE